MLGVTFWVVAAALAAWAHVTPSTQAMAGARRAAAALAVALLAALLLDAAARAGLASAVLPAFVVAKALLGLVTWAAVIALVSFDRRPRDLWTRVPLLGLAFVLGATGSGGATAVALPALAAFRWRRVFATRALMGMGLVGVLLLAAGIALPPPDLERRLTPTLAPLDRFQHWALGATAYYVALGVLVVAIRVVRDPSLGIRTVSRRLALSHVLVVAVPLVLTVLLWLATTVLGVSADRAMIATRALAIEGESLHSSLAAALEAPDDVRGSLSRWTRASVRRWPRLCVWTLEGARWERLGGEGVPYEWRLRAWVGSDARLPGSGLVALGDSIFLGAAIPATAASPAAVALVPASTLLAGVPRRLAGATIQLHRSTVGSARNSISIGAGGTDVPSRRSADPRSHDGLTITTPQDTFLAAPRGTPLETVLFTGYSVMPGIEWRSNGWTPARYLVSAAVAPSAVLAGLARSARENPVGVVPIILLLVLATLFGLVVAFDLALVANMGRSITSAIRALRVGADRLETGDLEHRIRVEGDDDLWQVAEAFNTAASGLARARGVEQERSRLESELSVARQIQARLLPAGPPDIPGLEIAGLSESAREVGGDYYDHVDLGDGRALLVIADVSGKGVPAALLMSGFRASLMSQDLPRIELTRLVTRLNDFVVRSVRPGRFVTAFVGVLDGRSGRLEYVNAGHNPPLALRAVGGHEPLTTGGLLLGVDPAAAFGRGETALEPGDLLMLYTDGVTEGADAAGDMWGEERLLATLRRCSSDACAAIVATVAAEVRTFEGDSGPADDVTLLAARRVGAG